MSRILMLYFTHEGQTRRIMERLGQQLEQAGDRCTLINLFEHRGALPFDEADKVVIGASIRYGHYPAQLYRFIRKHQDELEKRPSVYFGVNLTARKPEKNTPETNSYMQKFLQKTPWRPALLGVFAGALLYSRYNFINTKIIQLIMKITGGSTDRSKDIEFTDWARVDAFAGQIRQLR